MDLVANLNPVFPTCFEAAFPDTAHRQAPAPLNVVAVNPVPKRELMRFRSAHKQAVVYQAAARLWSSGEFTWQEAEQWAHDVYETARAGGVAPEDP